MNKQNLAALFLAAVLIALALALSGCGVAQNISRTCGGDLEQPCIALFGDYTEVRELSQTVNNLQAQLNSLYTSLNSLYQQVELTDQSNQTAIANLQNQITQSQTQIAQLQLRESVTAYLDCGGDGPGFDEIVLRLSSGKLVAYFEQSGKRFLTLLTPGSYQVTDASNCPFTITAAGLFCDSLGCR